MGNFEREIAKATSAELLLSRGCFLDVSICFEYTGAGAQHLGGYFIDSVFLYKLMRAFGVEYFKDIVGKFMYVTHSQSTIKKIEPIMPDEGHPFDIHKWGNWLESNPNRNLSIAEIDKLDFG